MSLNVAMRRSLTAAVRSHIYIAKSLGVVELGYDTGKNTRGEPKMISGILMGNWHISKF